MTIGKQYKYPFSGTIIEVIGFAPIKNPKIVIVKYPDSTTKTNAEHSIEYFMDLIENKNIIPV